VGNFAQQDGYNATNRAAGGASNGRPTETPQAAHGSKSSLLHLSLPTEDQRSKRRGRKDRSEKKRGWKKFRLWSFRGGLAALAIVLIMGGFLFWKFQSKLGKVFKGGGSAAALHDNVDPTRLKGEGDGRINILLLGRGGENHAGGDLTDTILVASVDPVNKKAALVSIPRDLWVKTPTGGHSKINAIYANAKHAALNRNKKDKAAAEKAGAKALQSTVKDVLGVDTHYYGVVDFQAFKQAVDTVGGVSIDVPKELAVKETLWDTTIGKRYVLDVPAGMQHFDGQRALFFTRSRHTSARGDFDRSERQRLFISALSQKILSAGTYTNPVRISQLMDAFGDHISTDFSVNDAVRLMQIGKGIDQSKIESIGLADPPNTFLVNRTISGQSTIVPNAGIDEYTDIHKFIREKLKDGYILKENANISVLNGTAVAGLATQKAEQLKTYGYNVGTVDSAPTQSYEKTVVVDLTNGKNPYTKNYLEKRFGVKVTTKLPDATIQPGTASFVIILGQNETSNR
jgi:polyisoprenyl-teichoic acid--peptidoglycan teichoic acid transferase